MLEGVSVPGPAFRLDPGQDAYLPTPGVHLHCASQGALRALLLRFADLATTLRHISAFCASVLHYQPQQSAAARSGAVSADAADGDSRAAGSSSSSAVDVESAAYQVSRLRELPTVTAFAAAVEAALQALQRQLLVVELAAGAGTPLTLLQLEQGTEGMVPQARLLLALTRSCVWRESAAESVADLLSLLHAELQQHMLLARAQGALGPCLSVA